MNPSSAELMRSIDQHRKITRQKVLDLGHYALNNGPFYQLGVASEIGLERSAVSVTVSLMKESDLLKVEYVDKTNPGRPRPMMVANTEKLEPLLDDYNELHGDYLADILGISREALVNRGIKSTLIARGIEDLNLENPGDATDKLQLHPTTTLHLGIQGVAAAIGLSPNTLHSRTKMDD